MQKVWAWRGAKQATIRATNNKASIFVCDFSRDVILFFFCAARLRLLFMRSVRRLPYDQVKIPVVSAKAQPRKHKVILPIAMVRQCHVTTFRYRRNIFSHFFQHVKPEKDVRIESGNIVFRAIGFRISYCVFSVQEVDGR